MSDKQATRGLPLGRVPTNVRIVAAASHLPGDPVSTVEVEHRIAAASNGYRIRRGLIRSLTGVEHRHYSDHSTQASDLGVEAARKALLSAGMKASDLQLLIWGSASQDLVEPATAHIVAAKLGCSCPVFDVKNACNSFMNAIQVATALLATRAYENALIVTGESPSRAIRWSVDSASAYIKSGAGYTMGDAGSAIVLTLDSSGEGIFFQDFRAFSQYWSIATLPGGGSMHPRGDEWSYFVGDGNLLRSAFKAIGPGFVHEALEATGTTLHDYAAIFCHQVSVPFLDMFCRELVLPADRVFRTVANLGNIASATMPTQLAHAIECRRIGPGDRLMFIGLGGGLSVSVLLMTL